jgi:CBS domain-containing protein
MITDESINFLKKIPPFKFLRDDTLNTIASNLTLEFIPKNSLILTQDGPPSDSLRVIKKGGVKIFMSDDDEIVIDFKSEGEPFGYLSLISGDKSRTNVQAIEDTLCYQIPKEIIMQIISTEPLFGEYFMKSFFKNYLDKTYREMRSKNLLFKEGEKLLYTTPVQELALREAVTAPEQTSIRKAADIMSYHGISSIVITDFHGAPVGIVTDRDLRDKVVAKGVDSTYPVKEIMSTGLVTVEVQTKCFDALATMIKHNIHHLLVTESGSLKGVVTNHDFMLLQGTSPLSLLKSIERQSNVEELLSVYKKIDQMTSLLLKENVKAGHILEIITELHDRLLHKIIQLSHSHIGEPPFPFAFFVYGSEGRKEQTFQAIFRCAIMYEDKNTYSLKKDIEEYCKKLLSHLKGIFNEYNFPMFDTHPLGENIPMYGDITEWERNLLRALRSPEPSLVSTAKKLLDARSVYGDEMVITSFKKRMHKHILEDERYLGTFIEHGIRHKSPIGFFKKFLVDESGEHLEQFNIKQKGILQIVDSLRALAVVHNIHETSTSERLNMLSKRTDILSDISIDIAAAFEFLLQMRLQNQLMKKDQGLEMDDLIEPENLSMLEKKTAKEIFQIIPVLQGKVETYFKEQMYAAR